MTRQPHRLPADVRHGFGGAELNREKPLTFRLNGRVIEAFEGDTVLSALLAAGIDAAGVHRLHRIALDERFAPPVVPRSGGRNPARAMPMDRVPALAGLDLVTLGPRRGGVAGFLAPLSGAFGGRRSLEHSLDAPSALEGPWLQLPPVETIEAETVVVGGGLAGMSAALAAADDGGRVLLVERRPTLGGDARFFGTVGDEPSPESTIAQLTERIATSSMITVLTHAEAFHLSGTRVNAHRVCVENGSLESRVVRIVGRHVVLATGAAERLPVFPGNRLPGVVGAVTAFNRAERYGVWHGRRAIFATPHNFTYRLALLAADAGIAVQRVADSRPAPQSRFIDFSKASGITLASGLAPRSAEPGKGRELNVAFSVAVEDATGDGEPMATELLVAAGGWQPRLALWLMAGGAAAYEPERRALLARGALEGVGLAGAAAGHVSSTACVASGAEAVASLRGQLAEPVEDTIVDAIYETPAGPTSIAPWRAGGRGLAYLDGGLSFSTRPPQRRDAPGIAPGHLRPLAVGDVAAAVELGAIPVADAGIVAEERCLGGGEIVDTGWRPVAPPASGPAADVPPYLHGRFGPKPQVAVLAAADGRHFEPGCLVYPNSDVADPLAAIGVILGRAADGDHSRALVSRTALADHPSLCVRDTSGPVPVTIVEMPKPASGARS